MVGKQIRIGEGTSSSGALALSAMQAVCRILYLLPKRLSDSSLYIWC